MTHPPAPPAPSPDRPARASVLGWGAYLACSWTWCIGMFLPVLLVRDYGLWGFVVFAVPNILGAGAMGWVLRTGASERIVERHGPACRLFTGVTLAFHAFWLSWLLTGRSPDSGLAAMWLGVVAAAAMLGGGAAGLLASRRSPTAGAALQWIASAGAMAVFFVGVRGLDPNAVGYIPPAALAEQASGSALLFLAPVCAFGFALCPYLDLTFHRTRRESGDDAAPAAFTLGFGLLFFVMIAFTPFYAGFFTSGYEFAPDVVSFAAVAVIVHLCSQAAFTVAVHAAEANRTPGASHRPWRMMLIAAIFVAAALGAMLAARTPGKAIGPARMYPDLSAGEIAYRLFMSFYGLVFPAYVWLCVIPARGEDTTRPPSRQKIAVLAIACALAAPCYWMGFIERETVWLGPGLGVVLLSRLMIRAASPATGGGDRGLNAPPSPAAGSSPGSTPLPRAAPRSSSPR